MPPACSMATGGCRACRLIELIQNVGRGKHLERGREGDGGLRRAQRLQQLPRHAAGVAPARQRDAQRHGQRQVSAQPRHLSLHLLRKQQRIRLVRRRAKTGRATSITRPAALRLTSLQDKQSFWQRLTAAVSLSLSRTPDTSCFLVTLAPDPANSRC